MSQRYTVLASLFALTAVGTFAQGDTCTTAQAITGSGAYLANGPSTGYAGPSGCGPGSNGDCYVYTPTFTGMVEISSCDPLNYSDDTVLKFLIGGCGSLACVAYNDDVMGGCSFYNFASYLQVNVVAGQSYYIVWTDPFDSGPFYWHLNECVGSVRGETYRDQNNNGTRDSLELYQNTMLEVNPGAAVHSSAGDPYTFCSDSGSYIITVPNPPLYHNTVPTSRSYTVTTPGTLITGMDFAFQPIPGIYDGTVNIWGWSPWIGNNTNLHLSYCNIGTELFDGSVSVTLDPAISFVSSAPPQDSVVGQMVYWSFANLAPGACASINFTIHTDSTTAPGDTIINCADLNINHLDVSITDNHDCLTGHATTSCDPNNKLVDTEVVTPTEVADQRMLEYTIHFQNTGTAPAVNIIVRDTVDADLDLTTFEMVGATHAYTVSINSNVITWTFAGIMLPDSTTDELNSHGGIHFKMAPKPGSIPGTEFNNTADIYFDFNAPVITNTTSTIVALSTDVAGSVGNAEGVIYPNPNTGICDLRWTSATMHDVRLQVIDAMGRTIMESAIGTLAKGARLPIDLRGVADGGYHVRIISSERIAVLPVRIVR